MLSLVVVVVCGCGPSMADQRRSGLPEYGVASIATLADRSAAGYSQEAAAIGRAGGTWIRIVMNWNETEPQPGQYLWNRLDDAVNAARAQGLSVLGLVSGPAPAWAGRFPNTPGSPARNVDDYGRFAAAVAQRYRNRVKTWELWNEPNLTNYWIAPNPAEYASLLRASYPRIKAVAPGTTVLSGGVSSAGYGIDATEFVRRMYAAGGGRYLDGVGVHPYTMPYAMGSDPEHHEQVLSRIRGIMDANGDVGKRQWVTEWGQPTGTGVNAVSEEQQATIIMRSLRYLSRIDRLGPVFLFTSRDWSTDKSDSELNFGLYRYDYSPKPIVARLVG